MRFSITPPIILHHIMNLSLKILASAISIFLISAASLFLSSSASAWHNENGYYDYEASNEKYASNLTSEAREAVKHLCVFRVRYLDPETGFVRIQRGLGEGCEEKHFDAIESFVEDISFWSAWVENTPHYQKAIRSSIERIGVDIVAREHISVEEMTEYLSYARNAGNFAPAIQRLMFAAYPVSCKVAKMSASIKFSENENLYGWSFKQTQIHQKYLPEIAEYICDRWNWLFRTLPYSPYGEIRIPTVDIAANHCYIPVVLHETEIIWKGQCFKEMFGGHTGHYWLFSKSGRLHGQRLDKSAYNALNYGHYYGTFLSGKKYAPPIESYSIHVISVMNGKCFNKETIVCEAWINSQ